MAGGKSNNGRGLCDQPVPVKVYDLAKKQVTDQEMSVVVATRSCVHCFVAFPSHANDVVHLGAESGGPLAHLSCQKGKERRAESAQKKAASA